MKDTHFYNPDEAGGRGILKSIGVGGIVAVVVVGFISFLGFLFVVKPAFAVMSEVKAIKNDATNLKLAMTTRDLVLLEEGLNSLETDLNDLRRARDDNFGWVRNFPGVKDYYSDSSHFIQAGLYAVNVGREFKTVITPFADAAGLRVLEEEEVKEELRLADAFSTWIGIMPDVAEDLDPVIEGLGKVGEELLEVDASRYPKSIRGIPLRVTIKSAQQTLTQLSDYAPDIKRALYIIPRLLGVGVGELRYAIIMQNDAEIRATGGFWTNYSTFKIDNALLTSDFTSRDMYSVDFILNAIDAYHKFPDVPPAYNKYLKVERLFARDANISPDFPTAVEQWMYFYNLGMNVSPWEIKPIEGVVAIDTYVVKELLEVTGPVTVSGTTFSADNVVLELEKIASLSLKEQSNRKKVLGDLMEGMLINVFESDKSLWSKLIDKGIDLAVRKHIQIYLFDEEAQALVELYNFGGRIIDPVDGDYVFVVSTNLGGDKTNLFVTKEVEHEIAKVDGRWMRTVRIKYTYNQSDPQYAPLVKVYRDWVRVYVPYGSELISVEGSDDEAGMGEERNKTYFHGYMTLAPDENYTMTFKYYLPEDFEIGETYNLYIQKQSGIDSEVHSVSVSGDDADTINLWKDYEYSKEI